MKVNTLLEVMEVWRPGKGAKDAFIAAVNKGVQENIDALKKIDFEANGKKLTATFTLVPRDENYEEYSEHKPRGRKTSPAGSSIFDYRIYEDIIIRGTLSNGDVFDVDLLFTSVSSDPTQVNVRSFISGGIVKRGKHTHYLTLPKIRRGGGGGYDSAPKPRIQIIVGQLAKYQAISDKLGKAVIQQKEKGLKQLRSLHADPTSIKRKSIHLEIDDVSKALKKLSIDNQLGKTTPEEFKQQIIELTDRIRSF